MWRY